VQPSLFGYLASSAWGIFWPFRVIGHVSLWIVNITCTDFVPLAFLILHFLNHLWMWWRLSYSHKDVSILNCYQLQVQLHRLLLWSPEPQEDQRCRASRARRPSRLSWDISELISFRYMIISPYLTLKFLCNR